MKTLRSKFTVGLITVFMTAIVLLGGVRMLSKAALFHHLEREHLYEIGQVRLALDRVSGGGRDADAVRRDVLLRSIERAWVIAGSVDQELFAPEKIAFRALGFGKVLDLPNEDQAHIGRLRTLLLEDKSTYVSPELAQRMGPEINAAYRLSEEFGPLVQQVAQFVQRVVIVVNLLGIGAVIGVFVMLRRSTLMPMNQALLAAQRIASGDLSGPNRVHGQDEVGRLNAAIDEMKMALSAVVGEVRERSLQVSSSVSEVGAANSDLSVRAESQAMTLRETASRLAEMTASLRIVAGQMRQADGEARQAHDLATRGREAVQRLLDCMGKIQEASRRVADINGVVNAIAYQTNLLALNAAVEAARAGEQGRGFSVVAGEVRSLAQRSADAATEVTSLVEDTLAKVLTGVREVAETDRSIKEALAAVQQVSQVVAEVTQQLNTQESRLSQVDDAMKHLGDTTQRNTQMAQQSVSIAAGVKDQAEELVQAVHRFKLQSV